MRWRNSATCLACSSCFASISWSWRRNWSLRGWFAGFLDMTMSFDGPVGCLRMDKALEIGRSPESWCTQALVYRLRDFLLGVSHTAPIVVFRILRVSGSSGHSPVTSRLQPTKQTRRRWWCSVIPLMTKLVFFGRLRVRTTVISIKNVVHHLV